MKTALTIAGSDPTGGAGVQLDIRVFHRFGVHGLSVITSITAQNTTGVRSIRPLEAAAVREQLAVLLEDVRVDALKTGMLYSPSVVEVIADAISGSGIGRVVVDPVTVSSSGTPLIEDATLERMTELLFPLTTVVTPNIYEASLLTGVNIERPEDLEEAAVKIKSLGAEAVIITGGHFPDLTGGHSGTESAVDLYYDGGKFHRFESRLFKGQYHGTGCAFSSALTANLALGYSALESARRAKEHTTEAVRRAYRIGSGMGMLRV